MAAVFGVASARDCCAIGAKAIEEEMNQWTNEQIALGQKDAARLELLLAGAVLATNLARFLSAHTHTKTDRFGSFSADLNC